MITTIINGHTWHYDAEANAWREIVAQTSGPAPLPLSKTKQKRWIKRTKPGHKFRGWRVARFRQRRRKITLADAVNMVPLPAWGHVLDNLSKINEVLKDLL